MPNTIRNRFEQFRNQQPIKETFNKQEILDKIPVFGKITTNYLLPNANLNLSPNTNFDLKLLQNANSPPNVDFYQNLPQNANLPPNVDFYQKLPQNANLPPNQFYGNLPPYDKNLPTFYQKPFENRNSIISVTDSLNKALGTFETNIERFATGPRNGYPPLRVILNNSEQQQQSIDNYLQQKKQQQQLDKIIDSSPRLRMSSPSASQSKTIILTNNNLNKNDETKDIIFI